MKKVCGVEEERDDAGTGTSTGFVLYLYCTVLYCTARVYGFWVYVIFSINVYYLQ